MAQEMTGQFKQSIDDNDMQTLISLIPYANLLGMESIQIDNEFLFKLAKRESNLGNPTLPAIHGGAIGGFMETAGALDLIMSAKLLHAPKVVDFSIDYLSPGRHLDIYAKCRFVRQGRKIANIHCTAAHAKFEDEPIAGINWDKPVAIARMNFLMS